MKQTQKTVWEITCSVQELRSHDSAMTFSSTKLWSVDLCVSGR